MFSTSDKRNSHSRSSKIKKDEAEIQKDPKRNSNKSKILAKLGKNISNGS
jgi:hypothetical protein